MKYKKTLKIFPKTFIGSLSLITGIIIIAFFLISILTPLFYRAYKEDALNKDLNNLVSSLENRDVKEIIRLLEEFALKHEYGITLNDQNGNTLFSRSKSNALKAYKDRRKAGSGRLGRQE